MQLALCADLSFQHLGFDSPSVHAAQTPLLVGFVYFRKIIKKTKTALIGRLCDCPDRMNLVVKTVGRETSLLLAFRYYLPPGDPGAEDTKPSFASAKAADYSSRCLSAIVIRIFHCQLLPSGFLPISKKLCSWSARDSSVVLRLFNHLLYNPSRSPS